MARGIAARRSLATSFAGGLLLAACSAPPTAVPAKEQNAARPARPTTAVIPALTLDGYKEEFARRVAASSPDLFAEPVPEMLKSIVVLDITIDRNGGLARVAVRRSNGYQALERKAMDSVRRAAPFDAPSFALRRHDGSVNFLETFLFRDDGRFQIRSLVAAR